MYIYLKIAPRRFAKKYVKKFNNNPIPGFLDRRPMSLFNSCIVPFLCTRPGADLRGFLGGAKGVSSANILQPFKINVS